VNHSNKYWPLDDSRPKKPIRLGGRGRPRLWPWFVALLFLVPFLLMLSVHAFLGLADNLLAAPDPGRREASLYNLVMVGSLYLGIAAALHHLWDPNQRGWLWVIVKMLCLMLMLPLGLLTLS
jgi:hypothetical protein